jgi:DNA-binding ferritin-like protein
LETVLATEKILGSLSESGVSNLEEKLYLQVESELKNFSQLTKNKIAEVITFLPGNKLIQGKIIRELEERSGQTEFFQEIGDKLKQLPVSSRDLKKCQEEVGVLGAELSSFKAKINLTELSENIKSLLEQAEGHLKRAEEIMNDGTQTGTFCGLVNSSGVLLRNVQRTLEKSQPAEIEVQVKSAEEKLAALTEQTKSLNQDEYSRIFDLLNRAVVGLESIKVNWQNNDVSQALRQLNSFDVIIKNIEKTLELVNNKLNKAEAKAMGLQKEFLKKSKLEEFYQWCQKQAGTILDDLSVLPYCLDANKNSLSMFDWLNKTQ